jgi:hypothetical protein
MPMKSTSVTAACCAILVLVVTQESAAAKQQHGRKHQQAISQSCPLNSNAYAAPDYDIRPSDGQSLANGALASGIAGH